VPKAAPATDLPEDFRVSITNAADPDAYPVPTFTYWLVPARIADPAKRQAITDFLPWMLTSGQRQAGALGYVALPESVVGRARQAIAKIR
jgi:phosphate transport system substrate-binding protein